MKILICLNLAIGVIKSEWYSIEDATRINKQIMSVRGGFDHTYIINDEHSKDDPEFAFLPRHMMYGSIESQNILGMMPHVIGKVTTLKKNCFSGLGSDHNRQVVLKNAESITICGYYTCTDVLATVFDVIKYKRCHLSVPQNLTTDLMPQRKMEALNIMGFLSVDTKDLLNDKV